MIEASAGLISSGEPSPAPEDVLDQHEMAQIDEEKLEQLGLTLSQRKDEWVTARKASGVEKRWMEDLDQYHGRDQSTKQAASMMDAAEQGYPVTNREAKPQRSTVYVNITRPKTNAAEARLANMLFPSDDRNWGLKPAPSPQLVKAAMLEAKAKAAQDQQAAQQGQQTPANAAPSAPGQMPPGTTPPAAPQPSGAPPVAPGMPSQIAAPGAPMPGNGMQGIIGQPQPQTATEALAVAEERCKAMQNEIDDQLIECQFNGEGRRLIHDMAVLGTGILKGPIVVNRTRKAWTPMQNSSDPSVYVLEIVEEKKPATEAVSPWNVFPDPSCGGDIHSGRGIYEYKTVTSKQLRDLVKQPGYLKDKIAQVLAQGPSSKTYISEHDQRAKNEDGTRATDKEHYQLWEYWGEFSPEDMRLAGVDVPDSATEALSGCVIFVNDTVIKGFLNPIETGDLPYDFCQWELVDGSPWGYGVPFLMRPAQKVLNAAWRQLMDNSGMSVGGQYLIKKKGLTPADGRWELSGRKAWLCDDTTNPADAMHVIETSNHGQEIQQIIELAMKFADEEASLPQLAQGEKGNAPDTVGGMTILMNSSNVVLSRMVKQYDDNITRPHIRRYYDWNMAYSDNAEIKGDFTVDARGSSALLVRDLQAQALLNLGAFQGSGVISPFVNWEAWFKQVLKLQHIDPTDIMKTDQEIAQLENAPPQATPEQVRAQAQLQVAQIRAGAAQQVAQAKVQGELQYAQMMQEESQQNHVAKQQEAEDARQMALLQYSLQNHLTLTQVKAELAKTTMQEETKRQLAEAEMQLKIAEGNADRRHEINMATHQAGLDQLTQPSPAGVQ